MKLLVGLGNPGTKYNFTRHNFGFLALDFYSKLHSISWQKEKMGAIWAKTPQAIFLKPQNFYNNSGSAVQAFAHFYKIPPQDLLVIADDFDLDFGTLRYRARGSDGGNNGLKSIAQHLKTTDFPRLRLGTNDDLRKKTNDVDFVLGHFTAEEKAKMPNILLEISQKIDQLI